jgi:hypothetical protein
MRVSQSEAICLSPAWKCPLWEAAREQPSIRRAALTFVPDQLSSPINLTYNARRFLVPMPKRSRSQSVPCRLYAHVVSVDAHILGVTGPRHWSPPYF